jgi:hypothetical protein
VRVAGYGGDVGDYTLTIDSGGGEGEGEGEGELEGYLRGDADLDGDITSLDIEYVLDMASGVVTPVAGSPSWVTADTNRDGDVTSDDALLIIVYVRSGGVVDGAPQNLQVESGANQVTLFWDVVAHSNVSGYVVYRSEDGVTFENIGTTAETTFTDPTVVTGDYWYYVATVDVFGNEGPVSDTVDVLANTIRVWVPEVWGAPRRPGPGVIVISSSLPVSVVNPVAMAETSLVSAM